VCRKSNLKHIPITAARMIATNALSWVAISRGLLASPAASPIRLKRKYRFIGLSLRIVNYWCASRHSHMCNASAWRPTNAPSDMGVGRIRRLRIGNFALRLTESQDASVMVLVWQVGSVVVLSALAASVGRYLFNRHSIAGASENTVRRDSRLRTVPARASVGK
jgi:hypothetical protein